MQLGLGSSEAREEREIPRWLISLELVNELLQLVLFREGLLLRSTLHLIYYKLYPGFK